MKNKKRIALGAILLMGTSALLYFGLDAARNHFFKKEDPEIRPGQQYYRVTPQDEKVIPKVRRVKGRIIDNSKLPYWEVENVTNKKLKIVSDDDSETIRSKKEKHTRGKIVKLHRKNNLDFTIKVNGKVEDFSGINKHYVRIIDTDPIEIETYNNWPEDE